MTRTTNNATINTADMMKVKLFHEYNVQSDITNSTVAQLKAFLDNVPMNDNHKMVTTGARVELFDIRENHGELLSNIDTLNTKCYGLSIWATTKDIGVRFNKEYIDKFLAVDSCKLLLDNVYKYTMPRKKRDNERRYMFSDIESVCRFLSTLFSYYNQSLNTTKEIVSVENVTA